MDTNDISTSHRSRLTKEQRRRTVAYGYGLTKSTAPKEDRAQNQSQPMSAIDPRYRTTSSRNTERYTRPEPPQRPDTSSGMSKDQILPRRKREELLDERRESWQQTPYYLPHLEQSISPTPIVSATSAKASNPRSEERSVHSSSSHSVLTKLLAVADRNEALMRTLLARMDAMDTRMEALARERSVGA